MPSVVQVYPSRVTITETREPKRFFKCDFNHQWKEKLKNTTGTHIINFKKQKNAFTLSNSSKKKLLDSVNSMYLLSSPRKVTMLTGKFIYNYKMSFVTLTLPSKQTHSDTAIKKDCLNQFLVELRKNYGVTNYVWKAELQQNANIHFHLILDKYVDYQALRRRWNRILAKNNYIAAYRNKFENLNLSQYHAMRNLKAQCSFEKSAAAFAAGKRAKWCNPNTVDVKSVHGKKELAMYLAKYVLKPVTKSKLTPEQTEREINFGRSWYRSYSLSNLKYINKYLLTEVTSMVNYLKSIPKTVKCVTDTWYTVFYFNVNQLCEAFKLFHHKFMLNNARLYSYPFP